MTQFDLFAFAGQAWARASDPDTAQAAAESVRGYEANKLECLVYNCLVENPKGLTSHELVEKLGQAWNTITPRIAPLVRQRMIQDSGERRMGPAGRKCIVLHLNHVLA